MGVPLKEFAAGEIEGVGEVPSDAAIFGFAVIANARIAGSVGLADFLSAVGGRIVGNDELEVGERLREQRIDGGGQVLLAVVDRQADADARITGCHRLLPLRHNKCYP